MKFHQFDSTVSSRRRFLQRTGVAFAGTALAGSVVTPVHAAGGETIKIALIGCGARGAGAAAQALSTTGQVQLWAMADAFEDRLEFCLRNLQRGMAASYDRDESKLSALQVDVPKERRFIGLDAYRHAIDSGVDVVLLVEPPGFRPKHFEHAVRAGKHVFMEKPVATDVAGVKRVLAAAEEAKKRDLKVGVGLQRRHQDSYLQALQKIREGAIGDVHAMRCYWNTGNPAKTPVPRRQMSELEYQVRNWYFFTWLSGDHICEQHVHNLDACNWIRGAYPIDAQGQGGRQVRVGPEFGNIFDHHVVEFTYADGTKMWSQCRQIPDCWTKVGEVAHGTRGEMSFDGQRSELFVDGKRRWRSSAPKGGRQGAYQAEHDALFDAIRNGKPYSEAEYGAYSTMTGILGRMATYSGKVVTWDEALASNERLTTDAEDWNATAPCLPSQEGRYPVARPGVSPIA